MEIILKIIAGLSGLLGLIILIAAAIKSFSHKGMLLAGLSYLLGGVLSIILTSWWPLIIGIIMAISIRKKFGEPNYASESDSTSIETSYEQWCKTYKPLMGVGEPLNYMKAINDFTDMTENQKDEYINSKEENNLFWSVIDLGSNRILIKPGRHEKAIAWWFCDIPYDSNAQDLEIKL